jgi:hypothetical protein
MPYNRIQILNMLAEGKIKDKEAEKLLSDLNKVSRNKKNSTRVTSSILKNQKYLRLLEDSPGCSSFLSGRYY